MKSTWQSFKLNFCFKKKKEYYLTKNKMIYIYHENNVNAHKYDKIIVASLYKYKLNKFYNDYNEF